MNTFQRDAQAFDYKPDGSGRDQYVIFNYGLKNNYRDQYKCFEKSLRKDTETPMMDQKFAKMNPDTQN